MLTDLLNRFVSSLAYAKSINRYGLIVPGRMFQAMQDMQQLEAEVQRLQDQNVAMLEAQKNLDLYKTDARRYNQIRNSAMAGSALSTAHKGKVLHGKELDCAVDLYLNKTSPVQNTKAIIGKPVLDLFINQTKGKTSAK